MKYIFEISYPDNRKELETISADTLEQAEEELEKKHSIEGANATYELYDVVEEAE